MAQPLEITSHRAPAESAPAHRVAAGYVAGLCKLVAPWEVPESELLAGLAVAPEMFADPGAFVPLTTWLTLLERARALTGEAALGIYAGLRSSAALHSFVGFGALSAGNLREAIRFMLQYAGLRFTAIGFHGHTEADLAVMTLEEKADFGAVRDMVLLSVAVGLWQAGSVVLGRPMRLTLDLPIARPDYIARFEHVLPPMRFERPTLQLVGPAAGLQSPVSMSDAATFQLMRGECERLCGDLGLHSSFESRLRRALPAREGFRSFDDLASELALSSRTLRRRLAEHGLSYAELVASERKSRALVLLRSDLLSMEDVSSKLGYSDVSTFARAFRRWVGCSPASYRRSSRDGAKAGTSGG
ncbi:MAG: AraC family transcriptional regulator ligand-binding domain-containing protein [Myxococcales bacterium]